MCDQMRRKFGVFRKAPRGYSDFWVGRRLHPHVLMRLSGVGSLLAVALGFSWLTRPRFLSAGIKSLHRFVPHKHLEGWRPTVALAGPNRHATVAGLRLVGGTVRSSQD